MLTKGQKIYMFICAIVSMLIAIVTFIPFRTLPFMCTPSNVESVVKTEMIVKLIVFPVVIIALSIFANVKKYHEIRDGLDRSKIINVMSYFPIISYLTAIIASIIHTMSFSANVLGFETWGVVMILLVLYIFLVIVASHLISKIIIRFDIVGTVIFDSVLSVIIICFILVSWRVTTAYLDAFAGTAEYVGKGDILLFFLYLVALICFVIHCYAFAKLFKKDNRSIYVNREMFEKNYDKIIKREYERAYNDILDDFELYFAERVEEEEQEKVIAEENQEKLEDSVSLEEQLESTENNLETEESQENEHTETEESSNNEEDPEKK